MGLLNFGDNEPVASRSKNPLKLILGIGALAGVIALGSTLAANINLNTGRPVEFGQGVAAATACDDLITMTPQASLAGDVFMFSSISLSNLNNISCAGKLFSIKLYGTGAAPLATYSIFDAGTEFTSPDGTFSGSDFNDPTSSSTTFNLTSPTVLSTSVNRITMESSSTTGSGWINLGSGGGSISLHGSPAYNSANGGYLDFSSGGFATGTIGDTRGISSITVAMRMNIPSEYQSLGMPFYWGVNDDIYDVWNKGSGGFGFNTFNNDILGMDATSNFNDFHNYVFIFNSADETLNQIYVDGVQQSLSVLQGAPRATHFPEDGSFILMQGGLSSHNDTYHQNGYVSAVKIYKRALGDNEAAAVFTGSPPSGAVIDVRASSSGYIR
jgi:hypothetical protein